MAKIKIHYVCQNCGYTTLKWLGKCPECGKWDSLVEETVVPESKASFLAVKENPRPKTLDSVSIDHLERMATGIHWTSIRYDRGTPGLINNLIGSDKLAVYRGIVTMEKNRIQPELIST